MIAVVAVDKNWGIGNDGKLLFHISEDMKNFRSLTEGKTVVLGRKTLATFPKGAPLKNRQNVILSRNESFSVDGAKVCASVENALEFLKNQASDEICVIGGESVYRQMLPFCDTAVVTKIDSSAHESDKFFPNLDDDNCWFLFSESEEKEENGIKFKFCTYKRK